MIFEKTFDNLTEADKRLLQEYFDGYDYQSSGHTFLANYIWRNTHHLSWQVIGEYLCVAGRGDVGEDERVYFMSFPLTKNGSYDVDALRYTIEEAKRIFESRGQQLQISLIPGHLVHFLAEAMGDAVDPQHDRDDDDYIYLKEELVSLSGRKLHQKKNHLNFFLRNYNFTYEEATPEMIPEIREYIRSKNEYKLGETPEEWKDILELENAAIDELLNFVGKGLLTGVIRIGGKIVAVTMGEFARSTDKATVIVHVEKADDRIRGLYQAINNEFCKRLPEETVYVNREEDMGMENLRRTKLSYKPYMMGEKYSTFVK